MHGGRYQHVNNKVAVFGTIRNNTKMNDLQFTNETGSIPTDAAGVESTQEATSAVSTNRIRRHIVPITANIDVSFTGKVTVYASGFDEAASKVQTHIDAGTLDSEINMEDWYSGYNMSYSELDHFFGIIPDIVADDIEVDEDEDVDPADVLEAEVEELQSAISWDIEKQSRLKVFLESLTQAEAA